jgi:phosphatidylglycerophosphate synthase
MPVARAPQDGSWRRHLPNALSMLRIGAAPVLLVLALLGHDRAYAWLLIPALLTDAVDGWIARRFHLESPLGARLDSIGDSLLWYAALAGVVVLHPGVLAAHAGLIGAVVLAWCVESAVAWRRYGRLSSFHTYASKAAGVLLSVYVGVLFILGHHPWLLYIASGASILASVEELLLLALCPRWRTDVKGAGWVWLERRRSSRRRSRATGFTSIS